MKIWGNTQEVQNCEGYTVFSKGCVITVHGSQHYFKVPMVARVLFHTLFCTSFINHMFNWILLVCLSKTNFFWTSRERKLILRFHLSFGLDSVWQRKPGILPPPPFWSNSVTLVTDVIGGTDTRAEEEESMNDWPFASLSLSRLFT